MTLRDIIRTLNATALLESGEDVLIEQVYCADLMSDVLSFSCTNSLLVTGLTNSQVVRTAEIADIRAIVFVQSKRPDADTIGLAADKGIPLLGTWLSMFDACGRLYEKGLRSASGRLRDAGR